MSKTPKVVAAKQMGTAVETDVAAVVMVIFADQLMGLVTLTG